MIQKLETPPVGAGGARKQISLAAIVSEHIAQPLSLQDLREHTLARRYGVDRAVAHVIASLAFHTTEATR